MDYFELRGDDEQLDLLNTTITIYQQYLDLTNNRFSGGVAALSDVYLAQTQLYQTQAQATDLGVTRNQFQHAIAVLTGQTSRRILRSRRFGENAPLPAGSGGWRGTFAGDTGCAGLFQACAAADSGRPAVPRCWSGVRTLRHRNVPWRPRTPRSALRERRGIRS